MTVVCDLPHDGETEGTQTISFAVGASEYEIDACGDHCQDFDDAIAVYLDHARRVRGEPARRRSPRAARQQPPPPRALFSAPAPGPRAQPARSLADRNQTAQIREWARSRGYKISDRGRIPASIAAEYHGAGLPAAASS